MNNTLQTIKYIFFDLLSACFSWTLFFIYRKNFIDNSFSGSISIDLDSNYFYGLLFLPIFWLFFYYGIGYYRNIYRRSRLEEFGQTLFVSIIGTIIIFFALILDDFIVSYKTYYISASSFFIIHFSFTYLPRLIITTLTIKRIQNRKIGFNTILIGSGENTLKIYEELTSQSKSNGNKFVGFIDVKNNILKELKDKLAYLGNFKDLNKIVKEYKIKEVIFALNHKEQKLINEISNSIHNKKLIIKAIPSIYDNITGRIKISSIFDTPLIKLSSDSMPFWQANVKRFIDILLSMVFLIALFPVFFIIAIAIKIGPKGSVFYMQDRVGRDYTSFKIYKFRSMIVDAERGIPLLSSKNDQRITKVGKFLRKTRLDEMPQFFNVLRGDMSLVGPRPERKYFIDKIIKVAPHYNNLLKIKPGMTSWGQIKFGYAENIDEMIERLKFDIVYLENMNLYNDFKILIYTFFIVIKASGK